MNANAALNQETAKKSLFSLFGVNYYPLMNVKLSLLHASFCALFTFLFILFLNHFAPNFNTNMPTLMVATAVSFFLALLADMNDANQLNIKSIMSYFLNCLLVALVLAILSALYSLFVMAF